MGMYNGSVARAATTSDIFNVVGDETRRRIVQVIGANEMTVGELVDALGLGQPQVSKHLKVLRDVDLLLVRTVGRNRLYRVNTPALDPLQRWLNDLTASINARFDRLDSYLAELQTQPDSMED
jgi:DNA-binding transcriptional ArsR family regulator